MELNDAVPTMEQLKNEYGQDSDKLCSEHEKLIE